MNNKYSITIIMMTMNKSRTRLSDTLTCGQNMMNMVGSWYLVLDSRPRLDPSRVTLKSTRSNLILE